MMPGVEGRRPPGLSASSAKQPQPSVRTARRPNRDLRLRAGRRTGRRVRGGARGVQAKVRCSARGARPADPPGRCAAYGGQLAPPYRSRPRLAHRHSVYPIVTAPSAELVFDLEAGLSTMIEYRLTPWVRYLLANAPNRCQYPRRQGQPSESRPVHRCRVARCGTWCGTTNIQRREALLTPLRVALHWPVPGFAAHFPARE
jgi:hypothetical protein